MASKKKLGDLFKAALYDQDFLVDLLRQPEVVAEGRGVKLTAPQAGWFRKHRKVLLKYGKAYDRLVRARAGDQVVDPAESAFEKVKKQLPPPPPT